MERCVLVLGNLLDLAVQLGRRCLINAAGVLEAGQAHSLQHAQHAGGIDVGGELRHIKADLHMALGGEVVDLVGPHGADDGEDAHGVAQIAVVQVEVRVTLQMGDALAVIDGGAADDAVDVVALFQQELSQIAAVLAGNAGDECFFHRLLPFHLYLAQRTARIFVSCLLLYRIILCLGSGNLAKD